MTSGKDIKTIIVTADTAARVRLKEALVRVLPRCTVFFERDNQLAMDAVVREGDIAAVFIHSTYEPQQISQFRAEILSGKVRYHPIFAVTLHTDHHLSDVISDHFLKGIEGFLKEPFAANDVERMLKLAIQNREFQIEQERKELLALQFMMKDALQLIDQAALERNNNQGKGGGFALRRMKRLRMRIRAMKCSFHMDEYEDLLVQEVEEQVRQIDLSAFKKKIVKVPYAEHPGKILTKLLEERSLTRDRLSELLVVEEEDLFALLDQHTAVTIEVSKELARVLGNTEDYWLSLQKAYEVYERSIGS